MKIEALFKLIAEDHPTLALRIFPGTTFIPMSLYLREAVPCAARIELQTKTPNFYFPRDLLSKFFYFKT